MRFVHRLAAFADRDSTGLFPFAGQQLQGVSRILSTFRRRKDLMNPYIISNNRGLLNLRELVCLREAISRPAWHVSTIIYHLLRAKRGRLEAWGKWIPLTKMSSFGKYFLFTR